MQNRLILKRGRVSTVLSVIVLLGVSVLAASCGHEQDHKVANQIPFVRLTGGPVQKAPGSNGIQETDSVSYTTEFLWHGWDEDGIIDHYQYAMDIPDDLLGEIDEAGPTGIAWTDTTAFRARFRFSTTTQDTTLDPLSGEVTLPNRYRDDHDFYVRAVDNEGGISRAAFVHFTARNVTPQTRFTIPKVVASVQYLKVGRQFNVVWQGIDPDNPDPRKLPKYYEWKLMSGFVAVQVGDIQYFVTVNPGPNFPWHRVGADTTSLTLSLDTGAGTDYVFAVRAIDEAGGTENKFYIGRNAVILSPSEANPGTPTLVIKEKSAGSAEFPGAIWEFEAAVGTCLRFDFVATAEVYGGVIQGYNYGIDVPDVEQEGPNSGFRGWTLIPFTYEPICFNSAGVHALTVKVRDTGGGVTIATVLIRVVAFPLDREVLYVDDFRKFKDQGVTDAQMDAMAVDMLRSIGIPESDIFTYNAFGDADGNQNPTILKLSDLARYRHVVWSVNGIAYNGNPALASAATCETGRVLQAYMGAGGSLMVYGEKMIGAFKRYGPPNSECKGTVGYSESQGDGLLFNEGSFPCDYLGLCGGDFRNAANDSKTNGLIRARPDVRAASADVPFPTVEVDSTLFTTVSQVGGIPFVDANFQPMYAADLDTIYTAQVTAKSNSAFIGKPMAWRYADPDPVPTQGPVALFGFPFHLLKQGEVVLGVDGKYRGTGVKGLIAATFDWFEQNGSTARAALSPPAQ